METWSNGVFVLKKKVGSNKQTRKNRDILVVRLQNIVK